MRRAWGVTTEAGPDDSAKAAQDLSELCKELYRLCGRIASAANRAKPTHHSLAVMVQHDIEPIERLARRLSTAVDDVVYDDD